MKEILSIGGALFILYLLSKLFNNIDYLHLDKTPKEIRKINREKIIPLAVFVFVLILLYSLINLIITIFLLVLFLLDIFALQKLTSIHIKNYEKREAIRKYREKKEQERKQYIEDNFFKLKNEYISDLDNAILKIKYVNKDEVKKIYNLCFWLINSAKNTNELNIAVLKVNKRLDSLYSYDAKLERMRYTHRTEYTNNQKTNTKKNNKNNYEYTVEGALKLFKLDNNATKEQIKASYRKLVMIHHPDKGGTTDNFLKLNAAYEKLKEYYKF